MSPRREPDPATAQPISRSKPKPARKSAQSEQELEVMELEERIAPRLASNHNHTFLTGS